VHALLAAVREVEDDVLEEVGHLLEPSARLDLRWQLQQLGGVHIVQHQTVRRLHRRNALLGVRVFAADFALRVKGRGQQAAPRAAVLGETAREGEVAVSEHQHSGLGRIQLRRSLRRVVTLALDGASSVRLRSSSTLPRRVPLATRHCCQSNSGDRRAGYRDVDGVHSTFRP